MVTVRRCIGKFEMEQWMNACDIELVAQRIICALAPTFYQNTIQKAIVRRRTKRKLQNSFLTKTPIFSNTSFQARFRITLDQVQFL